MSHYVFTNNATAYIPVALGSAETSLTLTVGDGDKFPAIVPGEVAVCVLEDRRYNTSEVVLMTARVGDVVTLTRGAEGTAVRSWAANTLLSHRTTAAVYREFTDDIGQLQSDLLTYLPLVGGTLTGPLVMDAGTDVDMLDGTLTVQNTLDTHIVLDRAGVTSTLYLGADTRTHITGPATTLATFPLDTDIDLSVMPDDTVILKRYMSDGFLPVDGSVPMTGQLDIDMSVPGVKQTDQASVLVAPAGGKLGVSQDLLADKSNLTLLDSDGVLIDTMYSVSYNTTGALVHTWSKQGAVVATMDYAGALDLPSDQSIVTKARGDALYAPASTPGVTTARYWGAWSISGGGVILLRGDGLTALKLSTGHYSVTIVGGVATADYAVQVTAGDDNAAVAVYSMVNSGTRTTGGFSVVFNTANSTLFDPKQMYVNVYY